MHILVVSFAARDGRLTHTQFNSIISYTIHHGLDQRFNVIIKKNRLTSLKSISLHFISGWKWGEVVVNPIYPNIPILFIYFLAVSDILKPFQNRLNCYRQMLYFNTTLHSIYMILTVILLISLISSQM